MNRKMLFLLALAIPLLTMGAGCASLSTTTPVTVPTASTPDPSLTPTASTVTVAPTPSSDGMRTLVAAESDATWVLYTNKALGYTVNTPTKGKYTPNWDMKYVDQSDPHIINGCYFNIIPIPKNVAASDTVVVPDGTKFCHIKNEFGDPPSFFVVDDYATAVGKKFIVIEFTKTLASLSVAGCTGTTIEDLSLSEKVCIPFVASDYQKTLDGIMGTFQMNTASTPVAVTTPSKDLEKMVVREKNELFKTYDESDRDRSSGYPVIFSNTTDPAVRYTRFTNSGGDAGLTTYYFVNQAKQKILQVGIEGLGGDFGDSGALTLSLNGGSNVVIRREQDVNTDKREITYKGLQVNEEFSLIFENTLIWKPKGPLEFTMLGVTPDLTRAYFSDADGLKQFSYDIASNKLQEVIELPTMAKPVIK